MKVRTWTQFGAAAMLGAVLFAAPAMAQSDLLPRETVATTAIVLGAERSFTMERLPGRTREDSKTILSAVVGAFSTAVNTSAAVTDNGLAADIARELVALTQAGGALVDVPGVTPGLIASLIIQLAPDFQPAAVTDTDYYVGLILGEYANAGPTGADTQAVIDSIGEFIYADSDSCAAKEDTCAAYTFVTEYQFPELVQDVDGDPDPQPAPPQVVVTSIPGVDNNQSVLPPESSD